MFNLKKEIIKVSAGIGYILLFYATIKYFQLGFWGIYIAIVCSSLAFSIFNYLKNKTPIDPKGLIKNAILTFLILLGFKGLFKVLGGTLGFFIGCFIIAALIIARKWKRFIEVKHQIESMLWGKPLKEYIENKERPPKIKIVK